MVRQNAIYLLGAAVVLGLGVGIGLTINSLWFPSNGITIASRAEASGPRKPRPKENLPVTRVVQQVSPSVVTVGAVKRRVVAQPWLDGYFPRVQRTRAPYMGSGFIVDAEGLVVTNFHVIDDSESLFVTLSDGREFPATMVDADRFSDVALLRVDPKGEKLPPPLAWGEAEDLLIGEQVLALGNPFGNLIEDSRPTVTVGYISALNRSFRPDPQNQRVYSDMIQTDAAINPGNSGGPLVDLNGDVIGVNSFIFSPSGASAGIGFAIPASRVRRFVEEIKAYGKLRPLMLDFSFRTVRLKAGGTAVLVDDVLAGGPAALATLKPGDLILEADGKSVSTREEFYVLFASRQVDDRVVLTVQREDGEQATLAYRIQAAK